MLCDVWCDVTHALCRQQSERFVTRINHSLYQVTLTMTALLSATQDNLLQVYFNFKISISGIVTRSGESSCRSLFSLLKFAEVLMRILQGPSVCQDLLHAIELESD